MVFYVTYQGSIIDTLNSSRVKKQCFSKIYMGIGTGQFLKGINGLLQSNKDQIRIISNILLNYLCYN